MNYITSEIMKLKCIVKKISKDLTGYLPVDWRQQSNRHMGPLLKDKKEFFEFHLYSCKSF